MFRCSFSVRMPPWPASVHNLPQAGPNSIFQGNVVSKFEGMIAVQQIPEAGVAFNQFPWQVERLAMSPLHRAQLVAKAVFRWCLCEFGARHVLLFPARECRGLQSLSCDDLSQSIRAHSRF